jgi:hypothetical protein
MERSCSYIVQVPAAHLQKSLKLSVLIRGSNQRRSHHQHVASQQPHQTKAHVACIKCLASAYIHQDTCSSILSYVESNHVAPLEPQLPQQHIHQTPADCAVCLSCMRKPACMPPAWLQGSCRTWRACQRLGTSSGTCAGQYTRQQGIFQHAKTVLHRRHCIRGTCLIHDLTPPQNSSYQGKSLNCSVYSLG